MNILFLDDNPQRVTRFKRSYPDAAIVTTAMDCIAAMEKRAFDVVFLDHDLGGQSFVDSGDSDCGMAVVRWICSPLRPVDPVALYIVHSRNPQGAAKMGKALRRKKGFNSVIVRDFHSFFPDYTGS